MYRAIAADRPDRYRVKIEEYKAYQRDGYIVVPGLVAQSEVEELKQFADGLLYGRIRVAGIEPPPPDATEEQLFARFSRIHMLHRVHETAERYLLHRRVLDVLEALIGPDVLALQTMLFLNPPGYGGQGWHQDAFYITTYPDTLIGAWIAIDRADEDNGCLWVIPGSNVEPIYPPPHETGFVHAHGAFEDLHTVENVSHLDDSVNTLTRVTKKYPPPIPVIAEPGDVVFFQGHLLHRSYRNRTKDRFRRAFVSHYSNARSWVPWNHGQPFEGDCGNYLHILARGRTHLSFAKPLYGTSCAALDAEKDVHRTTTPAEPMRMMGMGDEMMPVMMASVGPGFDREG